MINSYVNNLEKKRGKNSHVQTSAKSTKYKNADEKTFYIGNPWKILSDSHFQNKRIDCVTAYSL